MNAIIEYLKNYDIQHLDVLGKIITIVLIIAVSYFILHIRSRLITRLFEITKLPETKEKTLESMLLSLTRYIVYLVAVLMILVVFDIEITPLLAGAGVAGLAVGFGAQSLIKDIITGFFIMFEDQYHVGDFVDINGMVSGTIEELGLRMTTIREWSGKKFYVANSEIKTVRNYNRKQLRAIVSAIFPYEENPSKVRTVLEEVCSEVAEVCKDDLLRLPNGDFAEPPQIYGVTDIEQNERGGKFTIIALTRPTSIWTVEKIIRETIWRKCVESGIRLAYPRRIYETLEEAPNSSLSQNSIGL